MKVSDMKSHDDIAHEATEAALAVIDKNIPNVNKSVGPLGDSLAYKVHEVIQKALEERDKLNSWYGTE